MKKFRFQLAVNQAEWVFKPIRSKLDVINILMRVIKIMITYREPAPNQIGGHFTLIVDAMSRIIFVSDKKIYSLNFPFRLKGELNNFHFYSHHHQDVNNKATSNILEFINDDGIFDEFDVLDFATPIVNCAAADREIWTLMREILLWEDGYIRYDDDLKHVDGNIHPQHHLDIFYSPGGTFKIGLKKTVEHDWFSDLLDVTTDCRFLSHD